MSQNLDHGSASEDDVHVQSGGAVSFGQGEDDVCVHFSQQLVLSPRSRSMTGRETDDMVVRTISLSFLQTTTWDGSWCRTSEYFDLDRGGVYIMYREGFPCAAKAWLGVFRPLGSIPTSGVFCGTPITSETPLPLVGYRYVSCPFLSCTCVSV